MRLSFCAVSTNCVLVISQSIHIHTVYACTYSRTHSNSGNPLTPCNWRRKIITQIHSLNHLCAPLSYNPQSSHQMKHYTVHYIPVICRSHTCCSFHVCLSQCLFHAPLSISPSSSKCIKNPKQRKAFLPVSQNLTQLIESKNGRLGPGFL